MKKCRKQSLKKKLAAAMSAIGALNACAPIALPYVNLVRHADGVVPGGFVSLAHADQHEKELDDGQWQSVGFGVGTVDTLNGGTQYVDNSATGSVGVMEGGTQMVHNGVGKAGTLRGGTQTLMPASRYYEQCGGTLIASVMSGGTQQTAYNASIPSMVSVGKMYGGSQVINWGDGAKSTTGVVDVMSGGTQIAYITFADGNVGTVKTMYGGTQHILGIVHGASATVQTMNGGRQIIDGAYATGVIETMNGGVQEITSGSIGKINNFNGGTQIVSSSCASRDVKVKSGAVLEEHGGAILSNTTFSAGAVHRIVDLTSNGYETSTHTLEVAGGATTSGTIVSSGGTELVTDGGSSTDAAISKGGTQIVRGGAASLTNLNSGAQQIVSGGTGSIATLSKGGTQTVKGGAATVTTLNAEGMQIVSGGTGTVADFSNGGTQFATGGRAYATTLDAAGELQVVRGGTGTVTNLSQNGEQDVYAGVGAVKNVGNQGLQVIYGGSGGAETVTNGGRQVIYGGSGGIQTLDGGTQIISAGAKGLVVTLAGGTQQILRDGTGRVNALAGGTIEMQGGGILKGNLTGYGNVGSLSMGGTLTAQGGAVMGRDLGAGAVAVSTGGKIELQGDLRTETMYVGVLPPAGNPLVSAKGHIKVGTMDFSGLSAPKASGQYTFLSAGEISDMIVTRNGKSAALIAGSSVTAASDHETLNVKQGLALGCDTTHAVSLSADRHTLDYGIAATYTDAAFGTIPWSTGSTYFDASEYAYNSAAKIDLANLGFTFSSAEAQGLTAGRSMTLISGLPGTPVISAAAPASFPVSLSGANTMLSATTTGSATVANGSVKYDISGVTLDRVTVTGITDRPDRVPEGWEKNPAGVAVDTDGFTPSLDAATEIIALKRDLDIPLLTGNYGVFRDDMITGANKYETKKSFSDANVGVTFSGTWSRGVKASDGGSRLVFDVGDVDVDKVSFGKMIWGLPRHVRSDIVDFTNASIDASNLYFYGLTTDLKPGDAAGLLLRANNLPANVSIVGANHSQDFTARADNGTALTATLQGSLFTNRMTGKKGRNVGYTVSSITLNNISLANWNGGTSDVPDGWTKNSAGVAVDTNGMTPHPEDLAGRTTTILKGTAGYFSDATLSGDNIYKENAAFLSTRNGVTLGGTWSRGVTVENGGADLNFRAGDVDVDAIALGAIPWEAGASLRPNAGISIINYSKVTGVDSTNFSVLNPEDAAAGDVITLLNANATLRDIAAETKTAGYSYHPVSGVTVTGGVTGTLEARDSDVTFTATANRASNLNFRAVNWTGRDALMIRPEKISFNGAQVDTSGITFMNQSTLKKGDVTTLVADYDGAPGTYVGNRYRLGTAFEGIGKASMDDDDNLIFTVESEPRASEQTHNALMGAGAGMVALSAGNDFIADATGGLGQSSNTGSDGVAVYAQMGGGSTRQETGSHIDVHGWNAILALGRKNEKEKSTFEYGAFFEYGNGNYTTHNGDLRGDGSVRYTGGGLLAKWTAKHGLYVEGSLRAGNIHGETSGVLRDVNDNPYSYETDAPYWGLHLGVGRELDLGHNNTLDIYGKYFMNRRNGVGFTAGEGRYDLDALTSHILRVGARYTMKRNNWDFYGGLAYEHELDGKAGGTVSNGVLSAPIRGTDPTGGSVRMELGATMKPENSPWSLDLNLAGFAGKKRGLTGGVSVSFMF